NLRDGNAALAVLCELERRRHEFAAVVAVDLLLDRVGHWLAGVLGKRRLGIEGVDVRRPAVHKEKNDPFFPRWEERRTWRQRVYGAVLGQGRREQAGVGEDARQAKGAEAASDAAEDLAAGKGSAGLQHGNLVFRLARRASEGHSIPRLRVGLSSIGINLRT